MKYNTMKQYLGGGYMRPMGYQTGGYIPGISRLRYGIGLNTKVDQAQEDFRKQAEKVEKEQGKRALFGKVGGFLGTAAAGLLAPATGGASLALLPVLAKGAGSAIGSGIGEAIAGKVYDAGDITKSSTGLFDKDFTELKGIEEEGEKLGSGKGLLKGEGLIGRALGRGAGTAASALGGEIMRVGKLKAGARLAGGDKSVMVRGADGALTKEAIPKADVEGFNKAFEQSGGLDRPGGGASGVRLGISEAPSAVENFEDFGGPSLRDLSDVMQESFLDSPEGAFTDFNLPSAPPPSLGGSLEGLLNQGRMPLPGESGFAPGSGVNLPTQDPNELSIFGQAFDQARRSGLDSFMFEGNPYTTQLASGAMGGGMMRNYAEGGQLKQAPEGNKGLMKLPKEVRNRMGYMQEGGEVSKLSRLLSMISPQRRRQTAYEEMSPEDMMGDALTADSIVNQPMPEFNYEGGVSSKRDIPIPPQVQDFIDVGLPDSEGGMMSLQEMLADPENLPRYMQGYGQGGMMNNYMGGGMMDNYMYGGMAKKKKEYAGGGLLGMMPFKRRIV